jgi:hypothetical protein
MAKWNDKWYEILTLKKNVVYNSYGVSYLKGYMIIQCWSFYNWKESQLHVTIFHKLACQMQSTCKIDHCRKGNATKENLQTRKIEWTNRTYSRIIGPKWDQSKFHMDVQYNIFDFCYIQ